MSYFKHHVFMCTNQRDDGNQCCEQCGASELRGYFKKRVKEEGLRGKGLVRINTAGCLDRCSEGPTLVVYPEAVWYTYVDRTDLDEILESHIKGGKIVERLRLADA